MPLSGQTTISLDLPLISKGKLKRCVCNRVAVVAGTRTRRALYIAFMASAILISPKI